MDAKIREAVTKANREGYHFERKPVGVMINNVRCNIKADSIEEAINNIVEKPGTISDFKEGAPNHNVVKGRNIFFRVNGEAFKQIFKKLDGAIPYLRRESNTRMRLFAKINCKPFQCRDCFIIGQHQCPGRICGQCGIKGHDTRDCKAKTRYCSNCKKPGHRARDLNCIYYLDQLAKELRKMDVPIEYLEESEHRFALIKYIQLK